MQYFISIYICKKEKRYGIQLILFTRKRYEELESYKKIWSCGIGFNVDNILCIGSKKFIVLKIKLNNQSTDVDNFVLNGINNQSCNVLALGF